MVPWVGLQCRTVVLFFYHTLLLLDQWFRRRFLLKIIHFYSGGHFVKRIRTFCAILVDDIMRHKSVKLF